MTGVQTCALPICFPVTIINNNIQPTAKNEQQRIDELTRDNRKTFAVDFNWRPDKTMFAAYCQRKLVKPSQLSEDLFNKFVDKVSAKGECKTEAQWCENLASYLKTCLSNPPNSCNANSIVSNVLPPS